jgi:hypothetical protein
MKIKLLQILNIKTHVHHKTQSALRKHGFSLTGDTVKENTLLALLVLRASSAVGGEIP